MSGVKLVVGIQGGVITGITANVPVDYVIYDYDVNGGDDSVLMPDLDSNSTNSTGKVAVQELGICEASVDARKVDEVFGEL